MKTIRNRYFFLLDLLNVIIAIYLSLLLRLEYFWFGNDYYWRSSLTLVVSGLIITPFMFWRFGLYNRYWLYASVEEAKLLVLASISAAAVATLCAYVGAQLLGLPALPRSVPLIYLLLSMIGMALPRLAMRVLRSKRTPPVPVRWQKKSVVVMGAGDAGAMIVREIQNNPQLGVEVIGFLDDDRLKHNVQIHGVRVLGDRHAITQLAEEHLIDQVIIAMPTATGRAIREVVNLCKQAGVEAKAIPGIDELLDGSVRVNQIRNVQIEDLLRREPVTTDIHAVRKFIEGKQVLITGGGGSIGSELCRQVLRCGPKSLVILGHGEYSVFTIQGELMSTSWAKQTQISSVIADIRSVERIGHVFQEHSPDIVFHAAAHKHVPLMELNAAEAITNNLIGTRNVINAALATGVDHFVMISSDKAVNPTSIMGATKRASEMLVRQAALKMGKPYAAVRFGNVLGSRGSVVLTFKQQIAAGGPVTVTDPRMKRYFMTIPEAVQLVLQAAVLGHSGAIYVLDMGDPVKIVDLARDLIELSGFEEGHDMEIVFTGLRPGEKLVEELFIDGERRTQHEKIFVTNDSPGELAPDLDEQIEGLYRSALNNDKGAIVNGLKRLIPEYKPQSANSPEPALSGNANENSNREHAAARVRTARAET